MQPDRNSAAPLYLQLKWWLLKQIQDGSLSPGDQVPSESELGQRFRLSRGTVRQALSELISEGHLYLVRGRGTFVAQPAEQHWEISTFVSASDALEQQGIDLETHILELSTQPCPTQAAAPLLLEPDKPVVVLRRQRLVKGRPFMLDTSYLPEDLASGLSAAVLENRSLYRVLREVSGFQVVKVDRVLYARLASVGEAEMLNLTIPAAVHVLEGTAFDTTGRPVEYSQAVMRDDMSRFQLQSRRVEGAE